MGKFAQDTDVPADRSRSEIEQTLARYGADEFGYMTQGAMAWIGFRVNPLRVRFTVPMPDPKAKEFTEREVRLNQTKTVTKEWPPEKARQLWEQATRQRWRALALVVKAKLEAVESKITTFEEEFLAHIVTPDGLTIGEKVRPHLIEIAAGKQPLLPDLTKGGRR